MEDKRFGTIAALIANINRDRKKHPTPYKASDFYPTLGSSPTSVKQAQPDRLGVAQRIYNVMMSAWDTKGGKK